MRSLLTDVAQTGIAISLIDLFVGLVLATVLGMVIVFVYRWTHRGLHYERSFLVTLVMLAPIVAVVMMLIGSNLALSLGMVGALSIIRFRTVIKDSRDMVFLFFTIALGLGCGTYNWIVTTVATVFLSAVLLTLHVLQFGKAMHEDYVLVLSGQGGKPEGVVKDILKSYVEHFGVRSVNISNDGWEMVFEIRSFSEREQSEEDMLNELKHTPGVDRLSLLAPQLALPV